MIPSLYFENGGLCTTVQDAGRYGHQSLGIPVSGALDHYALQLANTLVGNPRVCAALEIRLYGPTVRVNAEQVRIALSGNNAKIQVMQPEAYDIPSQRSVTLPLDTVFRVSTSAGTNCCYLAVEGGFSLEPVLGSYSTYLNGQLGGFKGRELRSGDHLELHRTTVSDKLELHVTQSNNHTPESTAIRVIPGPQADYFSSQGIDTFYTSSYTVTNQTDRMGMRLKGPKINHLDGFNIPSDGIVTGAVQVPGDGLPIILLADRQTTGGYPKIACVASVDLPKLAQLAPGALVRFKAVSLKESERLRREREISFNRLLQSIKPISEEHLVSESALHRENLISGGEWLVEEEP